MLKHLLIAGIISLLLSLIFNITAIAQITKSEHTSQAIEAISIPLTKIGPGWTLKTSFYAPPDVVSYLAHKYDAQLEAVKNNVFEEGLKKLQINYFEAINNEEALKTYEALVNKAGKYNVIALKGNVVIEIIAKDITLKAEIVSHIQADKVHTAY